MNIIPTQYAEPDEIRVDPGTPCNGRAVACFFGQAARTFPLSNNTPNDISANEAHLKVMRLIEARPDISQREMAAELGVSLGKTNYCLRALIEKGFVKASNFRNSDRKSRYLYVLTPAGIERKTALTLAFLERKREEYEALRREIDILSHEVGSE